jgi:predicted RNase H-like nuclease (RuvC/YqgF family)
MLGKSGMKRLIVGVDPGVTVGLAALSLDGLPVSVESRRNWAFSDLIKTISELGEPTIISSDVTPASALLGKLSVKFSAVLFAPLMSMTADEKRQTARAYAALHGLKLGNAHEIDALASAVKAYRHYEKKFGQVNLRVKKQKLKVSADDAKDLVVRGHTLKRAIQILQDSDRV